MWNECKDLQEYIVGLRRDLHQIPELGLHLPETAAYVTAELDKIGIPYICSKKDSGIIATIKGGKPGKTICLRADMDALPIKEETGLPFASRHEGFMHACGHDTHITILLGTAKVLAAMKDELTVTVRFLFQPAEEEIANSGATFMKDEPLVKECERLIALHIWSKIPVGTASLRYGPVMSAADTVDVYIEGKGGHGALPHQTIDPIVAGAEFVNALQTVVSREVNPLEPAVLSVTTFQAGTTSNVIPASAHLSGTARTFSPTLREAYPGILRRVARGVGETSRAKIRTEYLFGPPPTINDAACVDTGRRACETVFGKDHVVDWELQMGGEDFAKYDNPKALLLLGGGFADASRRYPQHSPHYDIDERALLLGVEYFAEYVREWEKELSK